MNTARKMALMFLLTALACPWLAFRMHELAIKIIGLPVPPSLNLRAYANTMANGPVGKTVKARANAIRSCLNWEKATWLFAVILGGAGIVLFIRNPDIRIFEPRQYPVELEGCEGLTLVESSWKSPFTLLVNGVPATAGSGKRSYQLRRADGSEITVQLLMWPPFDVPRLQIGNTTVRAVPALDVLQWTMICIPLVLVFLGGALGGALGAVAALINARIARIEVPKMQQLLLAAGITAMSCVCYLVGVLLLAMLFRK